jgi:hypothetical protein
MFLFVRGRACSTLDPFVEPGVSLFETLPGDQPARQPGAELIDQADQVRGGDAAEGRLGQFLQVSEQLGPRAGSATDDAESKSLDE